MNYLIKGSFRRKANYWAAVASEAAGLSFLRPPRPWISPSAVRSWRRGLLIGAGHIGDVLYRTGSLPVLARATPGCAWSWACGAPADELLRTNSFVRDVIPADPARMPWPGLVRLLRAGRFDVVLNYDTGSYARNLLAAAAAGVPARAGYVHKGFSWLVTHPVRLAFPQPFAHSFRDLAAQAAGVPPEGEARPLVYPTGDDEAAAAALFRERGLGAFRRLLACALFTRQPHGTYPARCFLESLRLLRARDDVHIVLLGSRDEQDRLRRIDAEHGLGATVVAGDLGLRALYCLLRRCHAAFTPDSGVRHLANAAGIPVVFPRNPYSDAVGTGVYCAGETDVAPPSDRLWPSRRPAESLAFDPAAAAAALRSALSPAS